MKLRDVYQVGPVREQKLREAGIGSVDELLEASANDLMSIDGIGPAWARTIAGLNRDQLEDPPVFQSLK